MRAGSGIPPARAPAQLTKGEGYGSNRSREGPHTSSSGRWQAERGRRRAGAPRLARSKGPAEQPNDDGRQQVANAIPSRPRPHGLIPAEPLLRYPAPDDVRARLTTRLRLRSRSGALPRKKNPAEGGAQVLGRTNSEGRRVRSTSTNAQPHERFRSSIKNFGGRSPARDRMKSRRQRGNLKILS